MNIPKAVRNYKKVMNYKPTKWLTLTLPGLQKIMDSLGVGGCCMPTAQNVRQNPSFDPSWILLLHTSLGK